MKKNAYIGEALTLLAACAIVIIIGLCTKMGDGIIVNIIFFMYFVIKALIGAKSEEMYHKLDKVVTKIVWILFLLIKALI